MIVAIVVLEVLAFLWVSIGTYRVLGTWGSDLVATPSWKDPFPKPIPRRSGISVLGPAFLLLLAAFIIYWATETPTTQFPIGGVTIIGSVFAFIGGQYVGRTIHSAVSKNQRATQT
jgi:hypothetical protein